MSLRAVSVKVNSPISLVGSNSFNNSIAVKVNNNQDYRVKTIDLGDKTVAAKFNTPESLIGSISFNNSIAVKVDNNQDYKVKNIGFVGGGDGATQLYQLSDVSLENLQQDDVILYNQDSAKWENKKVNLDFGEY